MDNIFEDIFKKLQKTLYSPDMRKLLQTRDNYKNILSNVDLKTFTIDGHDHDHGSEHIRGDDQLASCPGNPAKMNITRRQ